ncbi:unnamed protein product [Meganyctiphanes norvegica]|uniref:Uncharacterized protein n=1 Tax=Meganyctiphanes norvegica TaxID=48144 RepID=A0AAV2RII6_MEGNR
MDLEDQGSFKDCIDIQSNWSKMLCSNETDAKISDSLKPKNLQINNESVPLFAVTKQTDEIEKQSDTFCLDSLNQVSKNTSDESNLSNHKYSLEHPLKHDMSHDGLLNADQSGDLLVNQCDISLDTDTGYSECSLLGSTQSGEALDCEDNSVKFEHGNSEDTHEEVSCKIPEEDIKDICSVDTDSRLVDHIDLNQEIIKLENITLHNSCDTDIKNENIALKMRTSEISSNSIANDIRDNMCDSQSEKSDTTIEKTISFSKTDGNEILSDADITGGNREKIANDGEKVEIEKNLSLDKSTNNSVDAAKKNAKENVGKTTKTNRTKRKGSRKSLSETNKDKSDNIQKVAVDDSEFCIKSDHKSFVEKIVSEEQDEVFDKEDMDLCNSFENLSVEQNVAKVIKPLENHSSITSEMDLCNSLDDEEKNAEGEKRSNNLREYKQKETPETLQNQAVFESETCLYYHVGKLCTIEEKRCIVASLNSNEITLKIGTESICKLVVWRGKKALQLSEIPDGKEVLFNAIKSYDNWNVIVMWLQKFVPSICDEPQNEDEYLFLDGRALNVEILSFDGNCGQARTRFDRDVVTFDFYRDQVFIDERRAPGKLLIMKLMWNSSSVIFGQIWKALRNDGSITHVCTCLWTGNGVAGMQFRKSLSHPQQRKIYRILENGCFYPADAQLSVYCDVNGVLKCHLNDGFCQSYEMICSVDGKELSIKIDNVQLYEGNRKVCLESIVRKLESNNVRNVDSSQNNTSEGLCQGVKVQLQRCIINNIQSWKVLMLQIDDTVSEENIRRATDEYKQAVVKEKNNKDVQKSNDVNQLKGEQAKQNNKIGSCTTENSAAVEKSSREMLNEDCKKSDIPAVLRDWGGTLQILDGSHFVIATKVNFEPMYIPLTKPPVYYRGEVKVNLKPGTSIKFDAVHNTRTRRYHVITLWEGTQPDYACIGPQVTFYFNVQGTYNGYLDKIVKLTVILGEAAVEIEALKTERVFTINQERLTSQISDGASLLLHLKKDSSSSDNKPLWSIPLMILNDSSGQTGESIKRKDHLDYTPEANGTASVDDEVSECAVKVRPKEGTLVKDLTCKVLRAEETFALLSALGNVIILQKQDFYSHGKVMCDLYTFHEEIYTFQNVGATVYEMAEPIIVCGENVSHVAMLAWGGKKPFNAYDIMRGWWKTPTKNLNIMNNTNLSGKRKRITSMTYYSKNKYDLSNDMKTFQNQTLLLERRDATGYIYKVMKTSGMIEVHSKFLQGGKAMAVFKPSALYINGAPLTCDDQLSWPFNLELYQGQCWHCLLESCPVENIDGIQVVFKAKLVWRGHKPTVQEIKEWNLYQLEQVQLQLDQCDEYHNSEGGWSYQELRQLQERLKQNQYLYCSPSQRNPVKSNYRRKSQNDSSSPTHRSNNSHKVLRNTSSLPPGYGVSDDLKEHVPLEEDIMDDGYSHAHNDS